MNQSSKALQWWTNSSPCNRKSIVMASYETVTMTFVNITNQNVLYTSDSTTVIKTVDQRMKEILLEPLNIVLIVLSFVGLVANLLSVVATLHIPHGQTTHSKLIINLAVSDICIILSVFLNVVEKVTSPLHLSTNCVEVANQAFLDFALLAILMNLLAMGIDHYIAILKPMQYHQIMSNFRGNMIIVLIWIISLFGGFLDIIVGGFKETKSDKSDEEFCSKVYRDDFQAMLIIFGLVLLELLVLGYIYLRIFCEVQRLLKRGATLHQDYMHNKKAIITTLLIIGTFMVCLVPNSLFQLIVYILIHTDREALMNSLHAILFIHNALWVLMLSNSICDPIIYALRLQDVQRGYKRMLSKLSVFKVRQGWWEEGRNFSRRNTVKLSISETEANEQLKQWAKSRKENGTPPTIHSGINEPKDANHTTENDHLLFENDKNSNITAADVNTNKRLVISMLSKDDKHTYEYNEDNMSEMTDLTPCSVASDKPFLPTKTDEVLPTKTDEVLPTKTDEETEPLWKQSYFTVNFLKIQTPKKFVVITLKFELCGSTIQ